MQDHNERLVSLTHFKLSGTVIGRATSHHSFKMAALLDVRTKQKTVI